MDEAGGSHDDVVLDPSVVVGTWANSSCVHRGRDELTIDFLRRVPEMSDPIRVARVLMSPIAAVELRDQLDQIWRGYSEWSGDVL
jgi:hypothetical protein